MAIIGTRIENGIRVELDVAPPGWQPYRLTEAQVGAAIAALLCSCPFITEVRASYAASLRVEVIVPSDDVPTTVKLQKMRQKMIDAATKAVGALPSRYESPR